MNSDEKKFEFLNKELLKIRKERKLSQEMLAEKVGVSRQSIHLWETGRIIPDYENVINLCNVLNINPSEIINGFNIINGDLKEESKGFKISIKLIIKVVLLTILTLVMIVCIKRAIVIIDINNSVKNYKELDYYAYKIISYDMVNNTASNLVQEEVSFKDGIYIRTYKENNKEKFMVSIDYNKIDGENINYVEGTTRELSKEEIQSVDRKDDVYELREGSIETKNIFTTIILILNPQIKISVKDNYIIEYENGLGKVKVWINKVTGLISNKVYEESGKTVFKEYDYKL